MKKILSFILLACLTLAATASTDIANYGCPTGVNGGWGGIRTTYEYAKMYFDVNTFKHMHLYDQENHVFKDVIDDELIALIESHLNRKSFKGYKVEGVDIQLIGKPTRKKHTI